MHGADQWKQPKCRLFGIRVHKIYISVKCEWKLPHYFYWDMHFISSLTKWRPFVQGTISDNHIILKCAQATGHEENHPLKIRVGFWPEPPPPPPPLSTAKVLIDAVGLYLLRVSEVWRLFAPDLRRWINSFSGSDFKPRIFYKTWYFCYFFTNIDQHF